MSSFLGPHLNLIGAQDAWFAKTQPRIAKILFPCDPNRLRTLAQLSPSTTWIGRIILSDQNLDNPIQSGRELGERIVREAQPDIDYWEGYNEIVVNSPEEMMRFAEHEIARTTVLHQAGLKSIVGNFSTGCPELPLWLYFYPALAEADALGLHEYSAPTLRQLSTWLCGRWTRIYESLPKELCKPLAITELGVDGGVIGAGRAGWKRYLDPARYLNELRWYDDLMAIYANRFPLLGATVFCWGGWGWDEYDIDGVMAQLLGDYIVASRKPKTLTVWRRFIDWLTGR
jgi:hypothetical protein